MALNGFAAHLALQASAASREVASGQQTVIAEVVERGLMGDILETLAWIGAGLVALFVIFLVYRRIRGSAIHGEEFSVMGLKGLHERGVISDQEYQVIKRKMAERITQRLAEESRRREEERLAKDPIAAIARQAKLEREGTGDSQVQEELQRAINASSPPPPPPPPPPPH